MYTVIFTTCANRKEAENIAGEVVKARMAACVSIIPSINSIFWWKGKLERAKELLLVIKTKKSLVGKLTKKIKSLHSYDVPEIIALPIFSGNKEYLEWIDDSTD